MPESTGTTARRISRPVPLRESAHNAILDMIVSGELQPGQHLVENELAVALGVSRQPVREALQWLKNDGWVDLRPGQGAFVHSPTVEEADQLLVVRGVLETESARLAAGNATAEDVEELRAICRRGLAAVEADDVPAMIAANADLHAAVTRMSGNDVLVDLVAQVDRRVSWYHGSVARRRGGRSWAEHADLVEAIAAGDPTRSAAAMRQHTELTRRSYLEHSAERGGAATAAGLRSDEAI
ncbi:GntR family transcriptional regulator [Pseudonocardia lacus]|uniref:GntR family transcriptional regulator n=1 Tax=Pseudonocardia lacus TaxID=2835865 RepID=UPI001BDC5961|nr:GntR family transcriptional regulator [Pseudonocardia lacus]